MSGIAERLAEALAGRYRLERELGQGGMATAYLAEDVRHHRKVAIKVLHPELSAVLGPDRFLKEIELTANLQHPHILPLFDSGAADGLLYYVMPYVEGESLRNRLAREKQLPIPDAVRIASEVAGALDYAHRRNVVHRDIKPENILLHDGRALVADFGIALAVVQAGGSRMTQTGMSLGTPQYMSPEQAMGEREISPRSDLYALGCVTYEMLTGAPPFTGPTAQAIVAQVLTETPRSISVQRHTVPEYLDAAVMQALEKLPADRWGSAKEFEEGLAGSVAVRQSGRSTAARAVTAAPPQRRTAALLGALLLGTSALAVWALLRKPPQPAPRPLVRFTLSPPSDQRVLDIAGQGAVLSPDGSTLVYLGIKQGSPGRLLYRWDLSQPAPVPLAGTESAGFQFFSPDGRSVGFMVGSTLRRVSLAGGTPTTIAEINREVTFRGATWTSKGEIVLATSTAMSRVSENGGPVRDFLPVDPTRGEVALWPTALPDGDNIVASLRSPRGEMELATISLQSGKVTRLGLRGAVPRFVEPDFLGYATAEGTLQAVRFEVRRHRVLGPPRAIAEGIPGLTPTGVAKFDLSRNGVLVYVEGGSLNQSRLVRVDRAGTIRPFDTPLRPYNGPRISPDGKRIAVSIGPQPNPPLDVWVYELGLGTLTRATFDSNSVNPEWSADGTRLYLRKVIDNTFQAIAITPDGSAPPESLYTPAADVWEVLPTRSGDTIITRELRNVENDRDLFLVPLRPRGPAVPLVSGPRIQAEPALSPDGKWLAYVSEESGNFEVYVRAFPGPGPRYQVSVGGGTAPRWNPRGGELFLLSHDSILAVPVVPRGGTLEFGRGKALFASTFATAPYHAHFDVSPDGTWFVFVQPVGSGSSSNLRIVLNWFDQPQK